MPTRDFRLELTPKISDDAPGTPCREILKNLKHHLFWNLDTLLYLVATDDPRGRSGSGC